MFRALVVGVFDTYGKEQLAGIEDLPVWFSLIVIVGEKQRVIPAVQAVNLDPTGERQRAEFPGNVDANAISGVFEFQCMFGRPSTGYAAGADNRSIQIFARGGEATGKFPLPGSPLVEGVIRDQSRVVAQVCREGEPAFVARGALALGASFQGGDVEELLRCDL